MLRIGMTCLFFMFSFSSIIWADIGPHQPLFIFEKNRNPQNLMVVYTKLDGKCRVLTKHDAEGTAPIFDFYWLMDGKKFKPVAFAIKSGIRSRLKILPAQDKNSISILMNNLKEVDTDLKDFTLSVQTHFNKNGGCDVKSLITLGPSDKNATLQLKSIYAESKGYLFPTLISITLKGTDLKTGAFVERKYLAKKD